MPNHYRRVSVKHFVFEFVIAREPSLYGGISIAIADTALEQPCHILSLSKRRRAMQRSFKIHCVRKCGEHSIFKDIGEGGPA